MSTDLKFQENSCIERVSESRSVVSSSLCSYPPRLLCPWNSPGRNTGMGNHCLLQEIFLTQGSNPGLPHRGEDSLLSEPPGKSVHKERELQKFYNLKVTNNSSKLSKPYNKTQPIFDLRF